MGWGINSVGHTLFYTAPSGLRKDAEWPCLDCVSIHEPTTMARAPEHQGWVLCSRHGSTERGKAILSPQTRFSTKRGSITEAQMSLGVSKRPREFMRLFAAPSLPISIPFWNRGEVSLHPPAMPCSILPTPYLLWSARHLSPLLVQMRFYQAPWALRATPHRLPETPRSYSIFTSKERKEAGVWVLLSLFII